MICFSMYSTTNALMRVYQPILKEMALTYPQFLVMLVLWEKDNQTVSEIGTKLNLDSGTLTPLLKRIESANLIVRLRDPKDERKVRITLTQKGQSLHQLAQNIPDKVLCALGLPINKLDELNVSLIAVRNHLNQYQDDE